MNHRSPNLVPHAATQKSADDVGVSDEPLSLRSLFDAEESALLRFAYGVVGHLETAQDLVQEAFLRLHEHWHEVEHPKPWLYRSVRNMALNYLRDHRKERQISEGADWESESPTAAQVLGRHEAVGVLRMLMAEMPTQDQQLISWKYLNGLSYEEISQQSGLSISNVGYKLHHLLKSLADGMRRMGVESGEG